MLWSAMLDFARSVLQTSSRPPLLVEQSVWWPKASRSFMPQVRCPTMRMHRCCWTILRLARPLARLRVLSSKYWPVPSQGLSWPTENCLAQAQVLRIRLAAGHCMSMTLRMLQDGPAWPVKQESTTLPRTMARFQFRRRPNRSAGDQFFVWERGELHLPASCWKRAFSRQNGHFGEGCGGVRFWRRIGAFAFPASSATCRRDFWGTKPSYQFHADATSKKVQKCFGLLYFCSLAASNCSFIQSTLPQPPVLVRSRAPRKGAAHVVLASD